MGNYVVLEDAGTFRVANTHTGLLYPDRFDTEAEARMDVVDREADDRSDRNERAMEAGMLGGVGAYKEAMGFDSYTPEPCGHHCGSNCPRCGEDFDHGW